MCYIGPALRAYDIGDFGVDAVDRGMAAVLPIAWISNFILKSENNSNSPETPDRNDFTMAEGVDAPGSPFVDAGAFSPFDFFSTRTPEEMALFDRFGDDYQDVVGSMDIEEQHHLKKAIKFEVPNHPSVSTFC